MKKFSKYITESKNTHMTHIEDRILDAGVEGTREAINFLRALRDMLAGKSKGKVNVTVKWDGAPAIFAGKDPSDGKFFVAKKGIFNKNPKIYKTNADIDADTEGDLNIKLKLALAELPKLGIEGVVQGDFLYSKEDIKTVDIDGEPHITFHPNTIVYAVPKNSELGKKILRSKIGVVWHTVYRGPRFEEMSASFGKEIASSLKKTKSVWSVDAVYKDVSGLATFTQKETEAVTKILSQAGKIFSSLKRETIDGIHKNEELRLRVNTFVNAKVREGQRITNPSRFVNELVDYIMGYYKKQEDARKSERGKQAQREKSKEVLKYFSVVDKREIVRLFELYNLIVDAKLMIVRKLDTAKRINTLLLTPNGYEVTEQEGFVAIDRTGKNAVKLIDRLQFSRANFSADIIKGWQR